MNSSSSSEQVIESPNAVLTMEFNSPISSIGFISAGWGSGQQPDLYEVVGVTATDDSQNDVPIVGETLARCSSMYLMMHPKKWKEQNGLHKAPSILMSLKA